MLFPDCLAVLLADIDHVTSPLCVSVCREGIAGPAEREIRYPLTAVLVVVALHVTRDNYTANNTFPVVSLFPQSNHLTYPSPLSMSVWKIGPHPTPPPPHIPAVNKAVSMVISRPGVGWSVMWVMFWFWQGYILICMSWWYMIDHDVESASCWPTGYLQNCTPKHFSGTDAK